MPMQNNPASLNITSVLSKITRIKPKIHLLTLSCPTDFKKILFSADDFEKKLDPKYYWAKRKTYDDGNSFDFLGHKIKLLFDKNKINRPDLFIELLDPEPYLLLCLLEKYRDLKVSKAEYTIDFICKSPFAVRKLYFLFKKYLVLKNIKVNKVFKNKKKIPNIKIFAEKEFYNCSYYLKYRDIKVYERGEDEDRLDDDSWKLSKLKKLRFEFTTNDYFNRIIFGKEKKLSSLIKDCKFDKILKNRFFFKKFKSSPRHKLPDDTQQYIAGRDRSYHNTVMQYKHSKGIPFKRMVNVEQFDSLSDRINLEIDSFCSKWREEAMAYTKSMSIDT
jgi:hypothetical protein